MTREILPLGTVLEIANKKYIITDYDLSHKNYICYGYPCDVMDLVPLKKVKEYQEKYDNYNINRVVAFNDEYKIIYIGYKSTEFLNLFKNSNLDL